MSRPVSAAREVDGVHRRLGAGVGEAPLGQAEAPRELLGDDDRAVGRGGEVGAQRRRARRRRATIAGLAWPMHIDAEAVVEVDVLVAVDVPDLRALAALEVDRARGRAPGTRRGRRRASPCGRARSTAPTAACARRSAWASRAR